MSIERGAAAAVLLQRLQQGIDEIAVMTPEQRVECDEALANDFCVEFAKRVLQQICENSALPMPSHCELESSSGVVLNDNNIGGYRIAVRPNRIRICRNLYMHVHERVWTSDAQYAAEHLETYCEALASLASGERNVTGKANLLQDVVATLIRFQLLPYATDVRAEDCLCDVCRRGLRMIQKC
jgi:hypothetical protein